jgi:hypothetical protein
VPVYLSRFTILLTEQTTPETYGRLLHWEKNDEAFDYLYNGIGMQPGEGLIVLEIQEKQLGFLLRCAESILHDLLPLSTPVPQASPVPPLIVNSDGEFPSAAAAIQKALYRVPIQFDFTRLPALVNAKRAEAEDHI